MRVRALLTTRRGHVLLATTAALAVSGGIAYATGSGGGSNVITACALNNVGSVRLIEPGKPGLRGRCSSVETQVTWNQKGQPGEQGPKGDKGDPGAAGAKGEPGAPGAPGAKGDKGDPGAQGDPGAKGDTGATGATGATGPRGEPGPQGAKGDAGADGSAGAKGDIGPQGPKGDPGAKGDPGPQGPKGDPGTGGGLSGYQVVSASVQIDPGSSISGFLPCPSGKKAAGGGWTTSDNRFDVNVIGSGPSSDGAAWTGGMYNAGGSPATLTLSVICVSAPTSSSVAAAGKQSSGPVFTVHQAGD